MKLSTSRINRRKFMHTLFRLGVASTCLPAILNHAEASNRKNPPNILFFLVDDMGWQDTSLPFYTSRTFLNNRYRTPNMERLAKEGVVFTQAYAHPICSPTRISLLTGMNPARHRVTMWTLFRDKSTDGQMSTLTPPPDWNMNGVQPVGTLPSYTTTRPITEETYSGSMQKPYLTANTLPELLRQNGYYTIHCGKAHFGAKDTPGANPRNLGFEVNIAGTEIGGPGSYRGKENYGKGIFHVCGLDDPEFVENDVFITDALTKKAIQALDKAKKLNKPFYLYMSHYAIHAPFTGNNFHPKYIDNYKEDPQDGNKYSDNERRYSTLIESMDKSLGDLLDYLEQNGLRENTIVLFLSDNGGLSLSSSGRIPNANFPLSHGKGSPREGGIREPMIVSWPGVTVPNTRCNVPLLCEDFFPSILEMAGILHWKTEQVVDGCSFVPALKGKEDNSDREFYWHCPNIWAEGHSHETYTPFSSIRRGNWKLIYYYENESFELFNIAEDISETRNLVNQYPDLARNLAQRLTRYLRDKAHAQRPTRKKEGQDTGILIPWPEEAIGIQGEIPTPSFY